MFQAPRTHGTTEISGQLLGGTELIEWVRDERGLELTHDESGVRLLEENIDEWRHDPVLGPKLGNEAGLFLGGVLVNVIDGARWVAWPNGHPVVRLVSGREVDVTALVARRIIADPTSLLDVVDLARRG
ncbi:MAG TPA: DUF6278 family protein [Acidimicrobiales bacterium]|nr:DUF6278 family protein [Acidimicrobiales bacterium]